MIFTQYGTVVGAVRRQRCFVSLSCFWWPWPLMQLRRFSRHPLTTPNRRGPWAVGRGPWAVGRGPWAGGRGSAVLDSSVLHEGHTSIRLEPGPASQDASVHLAPLTLTIGK